MAKDKTKEIEKDFSDRQLVAEESEVRVKAAPAAPVATKTPAQRFGLTADQEIDCRSRVAAGLSWDQAVEVVKRQAEEDERNKK